MRVAICSLLIVIETVCQEQPELFDDKFKVDVVEMFQAVDCEMQFAEDLLKEGVSGMSTRDINILSTLQTKDLLTLVLRLTLGRKTLQFHGTAGCSGVDKPSSVELRPTR